jgi:factor associated with neutral sphingomyelinase activation
MNVDVMLTIPDVDEKAIVAGSWDNNVYMYSIESGRVLDTLAAHDDAVSCLGLKNDVVVTGSWDATVKV